MNVLELISLAPLMSRTVGSSELTIGLIDGIVMTDDPCFDGSNIEIVGPARAWRCPAGEDPSAIHATSIASILVGARESDALAICPGVRLLNYPLFTPRTAGAVTSRELAAAIVDTIERGAKIVNLSVSVRPPAEAAAIRDALNTAAAHDAIVVVATANTVAYGGSELTRHPAVIPVVAYDLSGRPSQRSTFARSIGLHGVGAPGVAPVPMDTFGNRRTASGTSIAAAVVTGTAALLWSEFPHLLAHQIVGAVKDSAPTRTSVLPGLLDAWRAFEALRNSHSRPGGVSA